jgi:hypothetical protein
VMNPPGTCQSHRPSCTQREWVIYQLVTDKSLKRKQKKVACHQPRNPIFHKPTQPRRWLAWRSDVWKRKWARFGEPVRYQKNTKPRQIVSRVSIIGEEK